MADQSTETTGATQAAAAAVETTNYGSIRKAWDAFKTTSTADSDALSAAAEKIALEDKALGNWYARYSNKTKVGQLAYAEGELTGTIGTKLSVLEDLNEITKETRDTLAQYTTGKVNVPASKSIQKQATKIERDLQKALNEHLTAERALTEASAKMEKDLGKIADAEVKKITGYGKTLTKESEVALKDFGERFSAFADRVKSQYTDKMELHRNAIDEAKLLVDNLEAGGVKLNVKWSLPEKAAQTAISTLEHSAGQIEHGGEELAAKGGSAMPMVLGGAAIGAGVGYMASSDENKGMGATIGGIVGGVAGYVGRGWIGAKSALGAVAHSSTLSKVMDVAGHVR